MKERKYCFKLINHDNKSCVVINVTIYSNKIREWTPEQNLDAQVAWKARHIKWEKILKKHVKNLLKSKHSDLLGSEENNQPEELTETYSHHIGDYKLVKKSTKMEKQIVNMNANESTNDVRFRQTLYLEKYSMKYEKGTKPDNWVNVFNYYKVHRHYDYYLDSNEMDENIKLIPVGKPFDIPPNSTNTSNRNRNANTNNNISSNNISNNNTLSSRNISNTNQNNLSSSINNSLTTLNNLNRNTGVSNNTQIVNRNSTLSNLGLASNSMNRNASTLGTNNNITQRNNQVGGDAYQDKYLKYKKKYIDLKKEKQRF